MTLLGTCLFKHWTHDGRLLGGLLGVSGFGPSGIPGFRVWALLASDPSALNAAQPETERGIDSFSQG